MAEYSIWISENKFKEIKIPSTRRVCLNSHVENFNSGRISFNELHLLLKEEIVKIIEYFPNRETLLAWKEYQQNKPMSEIIAEY